LPFFAAGGLAQNATQSAISQCRFFRTRDML
jgi:hypothetical protein